MKDAPRRKKQTVKKSKSVPESSTAAKKPAGGRSAKKKTAVSPAAATGIEAPPQFDLGDSEWYLNRELTWLEFNQRVLHEAEDLRWEIRCWPRCRELV